MIKVKKNLTSRALVNKYIKRMALRNKLDKNQEKTIKKKNIIYSAKKTIKNHRKANSVLKPETNSLSPSIRSKGTLEESHKKVIYRIQNTGIVIIFICKTILYWKIIINKINIQKSKTNSYEISRRIDLTFPIKEKIQLEK